VIPTRTLVILVAGPAVLGLLAAFVPAFVVPMLALDFALLVVALLDALANLIGSVSASREVPPVQAVGRPFEVTVRVMNTGRRALTLRLTDDAPGAPEGLPATLSLPRDRIGSATYKTSVNRRGEHRFGPISVRWRSYLGLWERQVRLDVASAVRIYPDFAQLRHYGLRARADENRMPVRTRRRPGGENEFERLRPYVPGDPYRHIDWRATARRGDFVTREFGQEVNQNLIFLIDAGRMMSARNGALTSFDHALNAALMMGQIALRHGDRVGILVFDRKVRAWIPPKGGSRAGSRLIRGTYDVFPSLEEPDYALAFRHLATHVRRRSLVVLLTAVVDEVNADVAHTLVRALAGRHLPLCAWLRDTEIEQLAHADAPTVGDAYVRSAAAELVAWRERSLLRVRQAGALVVDVSPDQLTTSLIGRYLEVKARRLL
jgi:uncharacterized protein (DUF58 family)